MQTTWHLQQLREDVERVFGRWQREAMAPSLTSIVQRRTFANYHYTEAKRLIDAAVGDRVHVQMIGLVMGVFDKEPGEFELARTRAAAHITSCVHSMHSVADILGHVIYLALGMNRDRSKEMEARQINIYSVRDRLPQGKIKDPLHELLDHEDFLYLGALNNHSKHRAIVGLPYTVDMTGDDDAHHGMKFAAFDYDEIEHAARWAQSFLKVEYQRQEALLMQIGIELNAAVAGM